jgi:hypothetical protein
VTTDAYPFKVADWMFEGDELLPAADFIRKAKARDITDHSGTFYPARDDHMNPHVFISAENLSTLPLCSTHILWIKH